VLCDAGFACEAREQTEFDLVRIVNFCRRKDASNALGWKETSAGMKYLEPSIRERNRAKVWVKDHDAFVDAPVKVSANLVLVQFCHGCVAICDNSGGEKSKSRCDTDGYSSRPVQICVFSVEINLIGKKLESLPRTDIHSGSERTRGAK
jgi:hypothetical protein